MALLLFGYNREELINQHVNILPPDAMKENHLYLMKTFHQSAHREMGQGNRVFKGLSKNNQTLNLDIKLDYIELNDSNGILVNIRDINHLVQLQKKAEQQNNELEKLYRLTEKKQKKEINFWV